MSGSLGVPARASVVASTQITITSSTGDPNRTSDNPTSNAIDGNLSTATWTTPSYNGKFPSYLEFAFDSTLMNRIRIYKDTAYGPHDLTIQYTTGTGDLTGRSWSNVSGLTNGYQGTELLTATAVNSDGTVTGDAEDSTVTGWASLTFDTVTATGVRIGFSGSETCCNHYHVYEFQAYDMDYPPTASVAVDPPAPNGSNGWYTSNVHVTASSADHNAPAQVDSLRCALDPLTAPTVFADLGEACPYSDSGADVSSDGHHIVYAASEDAAGNPSDLVTGSFKIDQTPPTVNCPASAPSFVLGSGGPVSAVVTDATSGPASSPVSVPADVGSVGRKYALLAGFDNAGNETDTSCSYVVGYAVRWFDLYNGTTWHAGRRIHVFFRLGYGNGQPIPDPTAASLASQCLARVRLATQDVTCPTYSPRSHRFTAVVPVGPSVRPLASYPLALDVLAGEPRVNVDHQVVQVYIEP